MDELQLQNQKPVTPKKSLGGNAELMALKQTVAFLNNPLLTGAQVPKEAQAEIDKLLESTKPLEAGSGVSSSESTSEALDRAGATIMGFDPVMASQTHQKTIPATPPNTPAITSNKFFFTGRLAVGKDYVARAAGLKIFGFADPIYGLATHFFGIKVDANTNKDLPGMREFLQAVGQWGRGEINDKYPLNATRALFVTMIRSLGNAGALEKGLPWEQFGSNPDFWIDACLKKIEGDRVAITNCRFENEFTRLKSEGFSHWHIVCGANTWQKRLSEKKINPQSPQIQDVSEQLAGKLNQSVTQQLSKQKHGPKLRVIWNDPEIPSPSQRLYTLEEFLNSLDRTAVPDSLII